MAAALVAAALVAVALVAVSLVAVGLALGLPTRKMRVRVLSRDGKR